MNKLQFLTLIPQLNVDSIIIPCGSAKISLPCGFSERENENEFDDQIALRKRITSAGGISTSYLGGDYNVKQLHIVHT